MTVLITGANGQLGRCLQDALARTPRKYIAVDIDEFDITDRSVVLPTISQLQPDVIINAAAYTAVDKAEADIKNAEAVNAVGPKNLAIVCHRLSIPLIHVSTDYVFDGAKNGAYLEIDEPNPTSVYGRTKLEGEAAIRASGARFLVIRTSWLFSEYGNNFVKSMMTQAVAGNSISIIDDQRGCPTYAGDLAGAILSTLPQVSGELASGIYHYSGAPPCTWFQFAEAIFDEATKLGIFEERPATKRISSAQFAAAATRPANSVLDCSKFAKSFGQKPENWINGVRKVISKLQNL